MNNGQYQFGDKSRCRDCGRAITFVGDYWKHDEGTWRHPCFPVESKRPVKDVSLETQEWTVGVN